MLKNRSMIYKTVNSFSVEMPKFLYSISFRLAFVSFRTYHKKITSNNLTRKMGIKLYPIIERKILTPKDHKTNGL